MLAAGIERHLSRTFGLGSLLCTRLLRDVLGIPTQVDDATLVDTWVGLMVDALH